MAVSRKLIVRNQSTLKLTNHIKTNKFKKYKKYASKKQYGGARTIEELLKIANEWVGYGNYSTEAPQHKFMLGDIYDDAKIPEFMILFANYENIYADQLPSNLYTFFKRLSDKNFSNKNLTINCWQFILLCLLLSEYITVENIMILYQNLAYSIDIDKHKNARIPDFFGSEFEENPTNGNIILYKNKFDVVWHVGILEIKDGEYYSIDILSDGVSKTKHTPKNEYDTYIYISPEKLSSSINALEYKKQSNGQIYKPSITLDYVTLYKYFFDDEYGFFKQLLKTNVDEYWKQYESKDESYFEKQLANLNPDSYAFIKSYNYQVNYKKVIYKLFYNQPRFKIDILTYNNLADPNLLQVVNNINKNIEFVE